MIFDVFPFFNEIDLLEIRLNVLENYVDVFVICEFDRSFSGDSKPYYFENHRNRFKNFEHKIVYLKKSQHEIFSPFANDEFQKNSVQIDLTNMCHDDDIIIFGDLDEIPNPSKLDFAIENLGNYSICHFAQDNFMYFLNNKEISGNILSFTGEYQGVIERKWLGTVITSYKYTKEFELTKLRFPFQKEVGLRISEGGWHFSYVGSPGFSASKRLKYKLENSAHQEFNNLYYKIMGNFRLLLLKDFYGLRKSRFKLVPLDHNFPDYILNNLNKYSYIIR